jgi:Fic family protein
MPDVVLAMLHDVDRRTYGRIPLGEPVTNPATRDAYLVNSLMEEAITSSQLEGASTERRVAREMLRSGRPPRDHSEQMILNNYKAMHFAREHRVDPLSSDLISALHRVVTHGTLDKPDAAGRPRTAESDEDIAAWDNQDNKILHTPPPANQLALRTAQLCQFANQAEPFIHPVVRSIIVHFWLAYDHPFIDGNGRTARALFYWSMLHHGYWLTEFLSISRILKRGSARYGRSFLYVETDENDLTYFVLAQLRIIRQAVDDLNAYLEKKVSEIRTTERLLREGLRNRLNHRQIALLGHALKHGRGTHYTIEAHATSHGVSYMTARSDLLGLEKLGLLQRYKVGREFNFIPIDDFARRLPTLDSR